MTTYRLGEALQLYLRCLVPSRIAHAWLHWCSTSHTTSRILTTGQSMDVGEGEDWNDALSDLSNIVNEATELAESDNTSSDSDVIETDEVKSETDEVKRGCAHYQRGCKLLSPCCNKWYHCRFCHDADDSTKCLEKMDRSKVQKVQCTACGHEQNPEQSCNKCDVKMGNYFCKACRMYDDVDKKQFHCDGCGICRVGGRENFHHCPTCAMCYGNEFFDSHKCIERALDRNCPVCLEFLGDSTRELYIPSCAHVLHRHCFHSMLKAGRPNCPTCQKSMLDLTQHNAELLREIENSPMPEEYRGYTVDLLCNDCLSKSTSNWHVIGNQCLSCGSFNTAIVNGPYPPEVPS